MQDQFKMYDWIMPSIRNRSLSHIPEDGEYNFRIERAEQQSKMPTVDREIIIEYVNEFLEGLGMVKIDDPHVKPKATKTRRFNYAKINRESKQDIVWIKFTEDNYISVIGTGCDIYFSKNTLDNTAAGIINRVLGKKWDENDVLIFPLLNIPEHLNRSDIESGIGNYLISKNVPILDYYSHNY